MKTKILALVLLLVIIGGLFIPIKISKKLYPTQDAVFSLIVPKNNYGKLEDIHLYAWTQSGELNVNRVTIGFDLSSIPKKALINNAFLSLYFNPSSKYKEVLSLDGHSGNNAFKIMRITTPWLEQSVTWETQPSVTNNNILNIPKADRPNQDYLNIPAKALVADMVADPKNSFGFMLQHDIERPYVVTFLASKDHPQQNLHPQLSVDYTTNSLDLLITKLNLLWIKYQDR